MTADTRTLAAPASTGSSPAARRFLPEVQGLRAVAVLLVLIYHVDHDLLPGGYVGVDVFFVISGFLITTLLLREAGETGRVSLAGFYVRRIRRILPAAALVLAVTGALSFVLLPEFRLLDTAMQLAASAFYVENLFLADQAVDYLAAEAVASPVQHFWSLAVEEQFYLLWPLLFVGWAALPPRLRTVRALLAATLILAAASLACSVVLTSGSPQQSYFLPQTRMWELAVGGVLAIVLSRREVPAALRWVLGWAGLAAIGAAAWYYSDATPFPGWTALLPVLGAAAVIAAGHNGRRLSSYQVLSSPPARFVGDISYALYLWHWPLIVFALSLTDSTRLGPLHGALVLAASFLLAWATKVAVEDPVRRFGLLRTGRAAAAFAVCASLLVGLIAAGQYARYDHLRGVEFDPVRHVGPSALGTADPTGSPDVPIYPAPVAADEDLPDVFERCQASPRLTELRSCVYGPADADTTVAVTGDSHAAHWVPALREIARERGWRLHIYAKSSCAFTTTLLEHPADGRDYTECADWNASVLAELTEEVRPDVVFTSSSARSRAAGAAFPEAGSTDIAAGMNELWAPLEEAGTDVVAIRDTPRMGARLPECVSENAAAPAACARDRADAFADQDPQLLAAGNAPEADVVDLTDALCLGGECLPVIGNVMVYRDSQHLTATYSRLAAPRLDAAIEDLEESGALSGLS
ncbi:acyltransferase family protein [Streptomonospora nanhaiensis]|uniref:Peptidoglycan/LPS O-acetylase OafA/YrhL n=1 Tax=Streptomonospora nanhaiensis TaxID=1323731 RepID=A0A853BWR5_9ACTN|nr:acyltransferase family protein [Streptomonospora nanhaiensis]NYI99256.1 peptidoglycan/LPS O-acetylase OafA/YrhL [Streptomonospora nanhaiensis]